MGAIVLANTSPVLSTEPWAAAHVFAFENEAVKAYGRFIHPRQVERLDNWQRSFAYDPVAQAEITAAILLRIQELYQQQQPGSYGDGVGFWPRYQCLQELAGKLLRTSAPYTADRLGAIIDHCKAPLVCLRDAPLKPLLKQVEALLEEGRSDSPNLVQAMANLLTEAAKVREVGSSLRGQISKLTERLQGGDRYTAGLASSPWRERMLAEVYALGEEQAESARGVLEQATIAAAKPKPTVALVKSARALFARDPGLAERILGWIETYTPEPADADPNEDAMRALIWMLATADGPKIASRIGKYCELCFKKVPGLGARSKKLGNAAVYTLGMLGGTHAVAALTRLKDKVRYPVAIERIEATLTDLAARLGIDSAELEELALPTFELASDGERRLAIADGFAILRIDGGNGVKLTWMRSDGREATSIPKSFKDAAPETVAAARALKKEIEGVLAGQRARLESLYLSDRQLPIEQWRDRYLRHPLVANLARRLIWRFEHNGRAIAGLPRGEIVEDVRGKPAGDLAGAFVRLWHPLNAPANDVLAWRQRLAALTITQPFKQAHREIYLVTDAERQTEIYSNRFAAHILRQHQFKALCDQRAWTYRLMGAWDSHNTPTRPLRHRRLSVEYWVDGIETTDTMASGVYSLISTDQVRFVADGGNPLPVADVPPLVFSELMRDIDLFVAVASVGNDPNWRDNGPERYRDYWNAYAFGSLGETGKTRAAVIGALLPQLAISARCSIAAQFLVVQGRLRTYKIHMGSGNILMEPNDQYLCIV